MMMILLVLFFVLASANGFSQLDPGATHRPETMSSLSNVNTNNNNNNNNNMLDSSKRNFISTAAVLTSTFLLGNVVIVPPPPAFAKYGDSTAMEFPSYIDFLIERNSKPDVDNALYKGADPGVLLLRLKDARTRLNEIPALVEQKKWSQIQGILSGPLGTLSQTLNFIATPDSSSAVKDAAKKLKNEIFAIGQAASQKNGPVCTAKVQQASEALESFVKVAFQ